MLACSAVAAIPLPPPAPLSAHFLPPPRLSPACHNWAPSTPVQEVAHILSQATPRSLVLVDELGRATSTADGVGLAWAVGEQLLSAGAPTLFATHFGQLAELAALYPAAKAWHFDVDASRNRLHFSWRLRPGANEAGHYGLLLAAAVGFPPDVLQAAEEVVQGGLGPFGWWGSRQASGRHLVGCRTGWLAVGDAGRVSCLPRGEPTLPHCPFPAALDASEGQRVQAYSTPDAAQMAAVYDIVHKLACVAQSFAAATGGGSSGGSSSDVRSLQKQLRRLKAEAGEALAEAQAPSGLL